MVLIEQKGELVRVEIDEAKFIDNEIIPALNAFRANYGDADMSLCLIGLDVVNKYTNHKVPPRYASMLNNVINIDCTTVVSSLFTGVQFFDMY